MGQRFRGTELSTFAESRRYLHGPVSWMMRE